MSLNCLEGLVGIYKGEFGCGNIPVVQNSSSIDLFVTQDPSYNHCRFKAGDSNCDLLKLLLANREEAYRLVSTDISAMLAGKIAVKNDSGYLYGQDETGRSLMISEVPVKPFIRIATEHREGAFVEIQKVALMLTPLNNTPATVDLRVIRESDEETIQTYSFEITKFSRNLKPVQFLRLPCDGETYRVEYDYDSTAFVVPETNVHCGCGDKIKNARGFIYEQKAVNTIAAKSYGIALWLNLGCENGAKICALLKNSDYRMVIGYMIRKKIIEQTLISIYMRQEVNRFSLLSTEDWEAQILTYQNEYNERLKWFQYQTDFEVDGFCLTCSGGGMRKVSLLTGR